MSSPTVTIEFDRVAHRTEGATAFFRGDYDSDENEIWVWIPNQLLEEVDEAEGEFTIPLRVAIDKGLV